MGQSDNEMSGFLAELASEATQKLEAMRTQQQDREAVTRSVNAALERTFQFFNQLNKHLNAIEPDIPRTYALDGKTQFAGLKWKNGLVQYRKQSLADNALLDHVFFQVKLLAPAPVVLTRRWELYEEVRKDLQAFGLKSMEDMHDMWRNRPQKVTFQVNLEPEILMRMNFQGNYTDGTVDLDCYNLDGFGETRARLKPELLQNSLFEDLGRFIMGRANALPKELPLTRDFSRSF